MIEICRKVASDLVSVYNKNSFLLFPKYYNHDVKEFRVSEQETRILFSQYFFKENIPFSIEVPTQSKHKQSGKTFRSARYDMCIYDKNTYNTKCIFELKAHNPEFEKIRKDIEKFACSDLDCIWFHTLEKADDNTYKRLLKKFNDAIEKESKKIKGTHQWNFVIVTLQNKQLYILSTVISQTSKFKFNSINDFSKELL